VGQHPAEKQSQRSDLLQPVPHSSIFHDAETRRLGVVPIKGLAMTRYLAKSRNEANSSARETLESETLTEMSELARRVGSRAG
jgi:hypothetical protein